MSRQDERETTPERAETIEELEPKTLSPDDATTVKGGWMEVIAIGHVAAPKGVITDKSTPKL